MKYDITFEPRTLHFRQPAGTSRGVYTERKIWIVSAVDTFDSSRRGVGECAPLPKLSCDDLPDYEQRLAKACQMVATTGSTDIDEVRRYPSILFGLETALQHCRRGSWQLTDTAFERGEEGIPINGLIWMGSFDEMNARIEDKLKQGFSCIKLKIGAIDFDSELALLQKIRSRYGKQSIQLRVDANGAFAPCDAMQRLEALSRLDIHSIEQPIRVGQWSEMARLCRQTPLPIALDEELIGLNSKSEKAEMIDKVRPQYIVIKPSLHGGMQGTREWVAMADERNIGSWLTSALESNIGLNAIANLTADIYGDNISFPQGLGTGALFTDNIELDGCRLEIADCKLWAKNERKQ